MRNFGTLFILPNQTQPAVRSEKAKPATADCTTHPKEFFGNLAALFGHKKTIKENRKGREKRPLRFVTCSKSNKIPEKIEVF